MIMTDSKKNPYPGKICVALSGATSQEILALAQGAAAQADLLEIRLDTMAEPAVSPFIGALPKPLLFTNRAAWEGGSFSGNEDERIAFLQEAVVKGAAFVDIELKTDSALRDVLIRQAAEQGTQSIVSWHNFTTTPSAPALRTILQEQYRSGASIGKIVTMASSCQDVLRVLDLQTEAAEIGLPLIAFCMGPVGVISRVATLGLGGFMTYAAADGNKGTAPGQITISSMRVIVKELANAC
ncbi:MAG: type I 3-dehydroquinate dehydratase [Desulfobulbaceae bacterium]|nr:type I 3-dehydroquinate dehydratase [Desulfobulbaceae bacterium]